MDLNSWALWASFAGLFIAVAGLVLAVWWRPRSRVLITSTERIRLSLNPSVQDLQVTWKGAPVTEPILVEITCANHGTADIHPAAFTGGQATVDVSGTRCLGTTTGSATCGYEIEATADGFRFTICPTLLKSGEGVRASVLCDGMPDNPVVAMRLADVQTSRTAAALRRTRALRKALLGSVVAYGFLFFGTVIGNAVQHKPQPNLGALLVFLFACSVFATAAGYGIFAAPVNQPKDPIDYGDPND